MQAFSPDLTPARAHLHEIARTLTDDAAREETELRMFLLELRKRKAKSIALARSLAWKERAFLMICTNHVFGTALDGIRPPVITGSAHPKAWVRTQVLAPCAWKRRAQKREGEEAAASQLKVVGRKTARG